MVLVDINILSTFARVGEIRLLWKLFPGEPLGVTPTTCQETLEAVRLGCTFLQESMELIRSGKLQLVSPSVEEVVAQEALPGAFSLADKECLTISQSRGYDLLTNDRRLRNFCREQGVSVYDLSQLSCAPSGGRESCRRSAFTKSSNEWSRLKELWSRTGMRSLLLIEALADE